MLKMAGAWDSFLATVNLIRHDVIHIVILPSQLALSHRLRPFGDNVDDYPSVDTDESIQTTSGVRQWPHSRMHSPQPSY